MNHATVGGGTGKSARVTPVSFIVAPPGTVGLESNSLENIEKGAFSLTWWRKKETSFLLLFTKRAVDYSHSKKDN